MTLETYIKQMETWSEINENIPEFVKYHNFVESLKINKKIKGLPLFVEYYILPILDKKTDQSVKKVLELLDIK